MQKLQTNFGKWCPAWAWKLIVVCLIMRTLLGVWMFGLAHTIPTFALPNETVHPYMGVPPDNNPWWEPWQRWDTLHYQAIIERGYRAFDTALFTPPIYPLLVWSVSKVFSIPSLPTGLFVSGICTAITAAIFYRMAIEEGQHEEDAWYSTLYFLSFPTAFFLFAMYTESLLMLFTLLAVRSLRRKEWIAAGISSGAAALTHSPSILLIIPFLWAIAIAWREGVRTRRAFLGLAIALGISTLFPLYVVSILRQPFSAILDAVGRGGYLTIPGANIFESIQRILAGDSLFENIMELAFLLAACVAVLWIWRKLPRLYGIYSLVFLLLFLSRMGSPQPLISVGRYTLELFPAFMLLGPLHRHPGWSRIILYASWIGLLFLSGQFAIWGWAG